MYDRGENISNFLRSENNNSLESILISYDLQSGSYTKIAEKEKEFFQIYTNQIANTIKSLGDFKSIIEIGVGEATVLCPLMQKLSNKTLDIFGFDLSWSRVRYAKENVRKAKLNVNLFCANLFEIPLEDNSIDLVYTSHSIEPNGGKEKEALRELYRICNNYLVLLEPDYKNSSDQVKERMNKLGYVKNLDLHALELGYEIVKNEKFSFSKTDLNPTALTIIKKSNNSPLNKNKNYRCPITHEKLISNENCLYSKKGGLIYPVIQDIPSLISDSAILGSHFHKFI
tara:strand:- start:2509 stop:3363 length:855 start_codon:yes stop_codon:yes gene_type:complete